MFLFSIFFRLTLIFTLALTEKLIALGSIICSYISLPLAKVTRVACMAYGCHHSRLSPLRPGIDSARGLRFVLLSLMPTVFLRVPRVSAFSKIDSRLVTSSCGAVLRGYAWIVFWSRAPRRRHSSFDPTSSTCTLCNSVSVKG